MPIPETMNISSDDEEYGSVCKSHSHHRSPTPLTLLDVDATLDKNSSLFVPETPQFVSVDCPFISRCIFSNPKSSTSLKRPSCNNATGLIFLDSDSDSDGDDLSKKPGMGTEMNRSISNSDRGNPIVASEELDYVKQHSVDFGTQMQSDYDFVNAMPEDLGNLPKSKKGRGLTSNCVSETQKDERKCKKRKGNEEKLEERKRKKQEEKLQKEALKAKAAQLKKQDKEIKKLQNGKYALKYITAEIDLKLLENGAIGGSLLKKFAEKNIAYRLKQNPIEKSILWKIEIPESSHINPEVSYVAFVYEADEFCNLVLKNSFLDHIHKVQRCHQSFTVCYIINKLTPYINSREQKHYKNPSDLSDCQRPPVEEVLSKLTVNYNRVHSKQCMDEADVVEHIVGLTSSLATYKFRLKSTWLSVISKEPLFPKAFNKNVYQKSAWLKALVAIPKVQPRFAIAIFKKYPTLRSLLNAYLDPTKSVHDKEFLLKDLTIEGELGKENMRLGDTCSKRMYRIIMAQNGSSETEDVEDGSEFFAS